MQRTIRSFFLIAIALVIGTGTAAAQLLSTVTKTLAVGTATGGVGDTITLPVSISGDATTKVGGLAFTLLYDPGILEFAGISQATTKVSDGSNCKNADTGAYDQCDAATIGSTLFFQANDVKDDSGAPLGKLLVAAASAQGVDNGTVFNVQFKIKGGNGTYPVRLVRTIIENAAAGYATPTLLEPLVGLPASQPDANGNYPTDPIFAQLADGSATVQGTQYKIAGTVTYQGGDKDGENADGSSVLLYEKFGTYAALKAKTIVKNGQYAFTVAEGDYQIEVRPADPAYFMDMQDVAVKSADVAHDVALKTATRFHGTVVLKSTGKPLPGLKIEVTDTATGKVIGVFPTDENGYWETRPLDPNGTYSYKAIYGNQSTTVTAGDTASEWDLTLYTISGTISGLTAGMSPQTDIQVTAGSRSARLLLKSGAADITDNNDGTYAYTIHNALPADDWIVAAAVKDKPVQYFDGKQDITAADKQTIAAADLANIDFNFATAQAASIAGTVTKNGSALADIPVYAFDPTSFAAVMGTTAADGSYKLTVPPGSFQVFATVDNKTYFYSTAGTTQKVGDATTVTVANGEDKTGIDITVIECNYAIKGKVTFERSDGPAVAGALVAAVGAKGRGKAFTDVDGSYSIGGLCAGEYEVVMDPLQRGFPPQQQDVSITNSDATADFVIDTGYTLSGTITDTDGNNVAGAMIFLVDETTGKLVGGRMYFSKSDGSYEIKDIPSGVYGLNVHHPDYDDALEPHLNINADTTKDITLSKGAWIYGTVTDANDSTKTLEGAMVTAVPLNTSSEKPRFARSGSDGSYAIHGLSASTNYLLIANKKGYERKIHTPFVQPATSGTQADISLTPLSAFFALSGKVTKACDGSALAEVRVIVSRDLGNGQNFFAVTKTDDQGAYTFPNLPQATGYNLIVIPGATLPVTKITGIDGTAGDVTKDVQIECGSEISGKITLGAAADKVYVVLFTSAGAYVDHKVLTEKDDTGAYPYTFSGLAAGNYKVVAAAAGNTATWYDGKTDSTTADTVAAGTTGVDITLPKQ